MTQVEKSAQVWQGETGFINRTMLEKYVSDLRVPIYYVAGLPEMVDAMQTVLAEIGVDKGSILAEEFAGFKMGHIEDIPNSIGETTMSQTPIKPNRGSPPGTPRWVKISGIIVIALILLLVILHLTGNGFGNHNNMPSIVYGILQP